VNADDLDHPRHIVRQHALTRLYSDVLARLGQESDTAHPGFEHAEYMFEGFATDARGIG
jgi:hypothetical protein